ncbi:MAG: isoprenylcysteine carboxylmethyltransferase family protein [Candidatus Aminicenantes bacterium]|nr:isoprenylcysteine carboxylmethyltransferase family protein [Candidatus Aminicenantes bacterium]
MIQVIIFIILSLFLLVFTLKRPHRHRFYRYFAFVSAIGLVLLNVDVWFRNPFSLVQIISWLFLASSILVVVHGFRLLRIFGVPKDDIENTSQLVTCGAYKYIRHPIYSSFILGGAGAFLKDPSLPGIIILLLVFSFAFGTAKVEENENIERFGETYLAYMGRTKMFIPFLF